MKGEDKNDKPIVEKNNKIQESKQSNEDAWVFISLVLIISITLIFTTRMHLNANLMGEMIQHYTLRGKDVLIEGNEVVFVN